ncbi:vitellogenin receptor-like [Cetorhinus maximus]
MRSSVGQKVFMVTPFGLRPSLAVSTNAEAEHKETCAEYQCNNKCISEHEICDGIADCIDGTDEPESCEGTAFILTAGHQSLGILDLTSRKYVSIAVAKEVVAIAYDQAKSAFYWVDAKGTIFSLAENSSSPIYTDAKGVTSIAVDWFTGLIFWTNHLEERICAGIANGNGFVTILEKNVRPEQLVLFPAKSCMFWVNQRENIYSKAHIETAGMDGSGRKVVVVLDLVEPIGLTLDYSTERLYWFSDDHEETALCAQLIMEAVQKGTSVPNTLMGFTVFVQMVRIVLQCSLDTWEVQQDPGSTLQCDRTFFLCEDGTECVSFDYKCDGDRDCPDGSDEIGCSEACDEPGIYEDCTDKTDELGCGCGSDDFSCDDGQCISLAFRCDLKYDCRDHSDEHNCPKPKQVLCKPDEVMCPISKECIIKEWWCDDYMDCEDGMDEQNCRFSEVKCREFQWMCSDNSQCIPDFWHCDGQRDCKDGSDEIGCQPRPCRSSEFQCVMLECISMSLVCNGKNDCADGSDEGGNCDAQECKNCTHTCYKTPNGPKCGCENGFKIMPDLYTCTDVDECKELSTRPCSQICLNMNGTYHCSCYSGFLLHNDGHSCKVTGAEPVLLVSIPHDILLYGLHSAKKDILPAIAKNDIFSMDYDWKEKVVFWVDTHSKSIKWMKLEQQDKGTLIKGIQSDCIAVDWVGQNLYWTDGVAGCILAANLNSTWNGPPEYTVVVDTAVDQPHSLVLQPLNGLMYWAEIGSEPHIERAGMDGTNRKLIVKSGLGWPTSLTLDPLGRKLFWADGKLYCIGVANLDGTAMKLFQLAHIRRPFAVAVFEDEIIWSDVELRTVQKADRQGKNRTVLLKRNVQPYGLKVMHEVLQPHVFNPCEKMGCKHFCLLGPELKGSCRCGLGMLLADDGVTCMKSVDEPFLFIISPTALTQVYLKHLQPDTGLKVLPEQSVHQLINDQISSADYIWKEKLVYFAESDEGLIGKFMLGSNVSLGEMIFQVNDDIVSLSVDWLSGNLYWITSMPSVIEVASANGVYRLVLIENLYRSTSLALHPPTSIMCFSDWGSEDRRSGPRIECSNMDGQKRKVVWKKCRLPTGVLLAESGTRLYWIDLGYTRLWYSMMGQEQQWFEVEQKIVGLKVYSRQQQQGYSFCSEKNGGCNHLCLAYPGGRTCRCSTGYQLINGSKCEAMECLPGAWKCQDGLNCILNEQVCDSEKHCADGSDEMEFVLMVHKRTHDT